MFQQNCLLLRVVIAIVEQCCILEKISAVKISQRVGLFINLATILLQTQKTLLQLFEHDTIIIVIGTR